MSRVKIVTVSILFLLAVGAGAPSADAAACVKKAGTKFALCLGEPLVLTEGSFTIHEETDGSAGYFGRSSSVTTDCTVVKGVGTLTAKSGLVTTLNLRLEYSTCTVSSPAGCTIKEPIITEPMKGVIEELARGKILVTPQTGEIFTTVRYSNKEGTECLIAGEFKVKLPSGGKGGVLCTGNFETTRLLQLSSCSKADSNLEVNREPATYEGNLNIKLLSKSGVEEKWAVIEGT